MDSLSRAFAPLAVPALAALGRDDNGGGRGDDIPKKGGGRGPRGRDRGPPVAFSDGISHEKKRPRHPGEGTAAAGTRTCLRGRLSGTVAGGWGERPPDPGGRPVVCRPLN